MATASLLDSQGKDELSTNRAVQVDRFAAKIEINDWNGHHLSPCYLMASQKVRPTALQLSSIEHVISVAEN